MSILSQAMKMLPQHEDSYTDIDKEAIEDSGKIFYKFVDGEVSSQAMDLIAVSIPPETLEGLVSQRYKGHIQEKMHASHR